MRHDYYGVPVWLMREYLADLGGTALDEHVVAGVGWQADVRRAEPRHLGSLVVGGATVEFSGDPEALALLFKKLHLKTLRGGG
jgi:hypothetical protein